MKNFDNIKKNWNMLKFGKKLYCKNIWFIAYLKINKNIYK